MTDTLLERDVIGDPQPSEAAGLLAREADHRIKNNLQVVGSLLQRQARGANDPLVRDALMVASTRIAAVAQVHASLHALASRSLVVAEIDLAVHLSRLCASIGVMMGVDGLRHAMRVDVEPVAVMPGMAQHIGQVVTELVTNAVRHGVTLPRQGTVWVTGEALGPGRYRIRVRDDGAGVGEDFDLVPRPRGRDLGRGPGLGLRLVNGLVEQLQGQITVDRLDPGTQFTLVVPLHGAVPHG